MPIIKDRDLLNEDGSVPIELLVKCFENHNEIKLRYEKMHRYYDGMHDILNRTLSNDQLPNNKLICNHAEYISDMAIGYVFGTPISYTGDSVDELNDIFIEIVNNAKLQQSIIHSYNYDNFINNLLENME